MSSAAAPPDFASRRAVLLEQIADHLLAHGLGGTSLRPLARATGTSDRMLLYYFKDKAELIEAALAVVAARLQALLPAPDAAPPAHVEAVAQRLGTALLGEAHWPYMRLWLEIASRAAAGDAACRAAGAAIGRHFHGWGAAQLTPAAPGEPASAHDSARLLLLIEGAVLLKALGLADLAKAGLGD